MSERNIFLDFNKKIYTCGYALNIRMENNLYFMIACQHTHFNNTNLIIIIKYFLFQSIHWENNGCTNNDKIHL
jgi:hypothetical protein